jgi:hypothetical protein
MRGVFFFEGNAVPPEREESSSRSLLWACRQERERNGSCPGGIVQNCREKTVSSGNGGTALSRAGIKAFLLIE